MRRDGRRRRRRRGGGGGEDAWLVLGWSWIVDELEGVGRAGGGIICVCANIGRETGGPCGEDREQEKVDQGKKCEREKRPRRNIKDSVSSLNSAGDSRS